MKRLTFSFLLFLSSCMVGPNYRQPTVALPETFVEEKPEEAKPSNADLCHWWTQLNDPYLDALLEEAVRMNYDFRIAAEKICQARATYRIERSKVWPEIDFNASTTRSLFSPNFISPRDFSTGTGQSSPFQNLFEIGFDAIWELDVWGKFRRSKNAAYDLWEASAEEAEVVLISMLSEVAVDYINIRALQQKIALMHQKIALDKEELSLAASLFDAGLGNEQQVMTLLSTLETDQASLLTLDTSLKETLHSLAYLLAR
jgi:Outer membrane protein